MKHLTDDLVSETTTTSSTATKEHGGKGGGGGDGGINKQRTVADQDREIRLSSGIRKKKIEQVMGMLEREYVLSLLFPSLPSFLPSFLLNLSIHFIILFVEYLSGFLGFHL